MNDSGPKSQAPIIQIVKFRLVENNCKYLGLKSDFLLHNSIHVMKFTLSMQKGDINNAQSRVEMLENTLLQPLKQQVRLAEIRTKRKYQIF